MSATMQARDRTPRCLRPVWLEKYLSFDDLVESRYPSRMPIPMPFDSVARLPTAGDNAAMALRTLEAGTRIAHAAGEIVLERTVLLGHRFAVRSLDAGDQLLSWGLPLGNALRPIP